MPEGVSAIRGHVRSRIHWFRVPDVSVVCLGLIAVGIALLRSDARGDEVRAADGSVVRLRRYEFQSSTVRYHQAEQPIKQAIWNSLPKDLKKKISRPGVTAFVYPIFTNEPVLSAAFSAHDASGKPQDAGTRMVVLDDRGQAFDEVVNFMSGSGVFEAVAFPRRGRKLTLRLMDGEKPMAEFKIPNPCPGPHPVWKPQPMPVVVTNGPLELSLVNFDVARQRTRCAFRVRERGQDTTAYLPVEFEISDATGNHWRPKVARPAEVTNGLITATLFGALWPEEEAWKLRVEFKPADKNSEDQSAQVAEFLAKPDQETGDSR
jgi:hypothetical protein